MKELKRRVNKIDPTHFLTFKPYNILSPFVIGKRARLESLNRNPFDADFERRLIFLMPTYEYSCQKCGQNFDAFQSMRDEPFRECPKELCRLPKWGHGKVKRLLGTGAGLIFKGSGFYTTDYRSDSYKEAAKKRLLPARLAEKNPPSPRNPRKALRLFRLRRLRKNRPKKPAHDAVTGIKIFSEAPQLPCAGITAPG